MLEPEISNLKKLFPKSAEPEIKKDKAENLGQLFDLSDEKKKEVIEYLIRCVDESKKQREHWLEIRSECIRNYEGESSLKGPWEGSSNISTMVTTIAVDMIHSKIFPMVWNPEIIYWKGTTGHNEEVAENNRLFSQWILTKSMTDTQEKVDEITGRLVAEGIIVVKRKWEKKYHRVTRLTPDSSDSKGNIKYEVSYDKVKRERARWIIRDPEHVYFPYNCSNEDDADYIIDEIYYTLPMLREMKKDGLFLPDVTIEAIKKAMLEKYDPAGAQKARLDSAGIETFSAGIETMPIKCYEGYVKYDIKGDGEREECIFLCLPDIKLFLSGKPLHTVSRIGKRPWKIRGFLPRPGTVYAKGIAELVRNFHAELDAIHNQRIDAGNMVIAPFFFYRATSGFDPATISVKPATGIPLDDVQRDVNFPDYNPSRLSVSYQEETLLMELISKLTYLPPTAFGRETANRPTARGTIALIAESSQPFNLLAARVLKIVLEIITDTRKMYEEHWNNDYAKFILNDKGYQRWEALSPEMIAGDLIAFSEIDLEKSNQAFEAQADQILFQTLAQDPLVNQNPAFAWELRAGFIKGLGKKNVEKYIGPKPDYEANPGIVEDENLLLFQEQNVQVNPNQDHVAHMNGHAKFKREMVSVLTPEAMRKIVMHIFEHQAAHAQRLQQLAITYNQQGGAGVNQGEAGSSGAFGAPSMANIQGPPVGNSNNSR